MEDIRKMTAFGNVPKPGYELMNKDVKIAAFVINDAFSSVTITKQFVELPFWIHNFGAFVQNRQAPKHRENIAQLLRMSGCDTLRFIQYVIFLHQKSLDIFPMRLLNRKILRLTLYSIRHQNTDLNPNFARCL